MWKLVALAAGAVGWLAARKYFAGGVCSEESLRNLRGKRILITGANTGIGKATAIEAAKAGAARITVACRPSDKTTAAVDEIRAAALKAKNNECVVETVPLDLTDLSSVRGAVDRLARKGDVFDILINNAGVMATPKMQTKDGFEMQFGTNHLGHFAFTNLIINKQLIAEPGRIVNVSSRAHRGAKGGLDFDDLMNDKNYNPRLTYARSKLANILFTSELQRRLTASHKNIVAVSLHPGVVRTELGRSMNPYLLYSAVVLLSPLVFTALKSPTEGAQTTLHCAAATEVASQGGAYFSDCVVTPTQHTDDASARRLWQVSEGLVNVTATW